jgi:hypothetical protein
MPEPLTRYISSRFHIGKDGGVKYNLFMPKNGETSVIRISGMSEPEIWKDADARRQGVFARADIDSSLIVFAELKLMPDSIRHANIRNWPPTDSEVKLKAMQLASASRPKFR